MQIQPEVLATPLGAYGPGDRQLPRAPFSSLHLRLLRSLCPSPAHSCLAVPHHGRLLFSLSAEGSWSRSGPRGTLALAGSSHGTTTAPTVLPHLPTTPPLLSPSHSPSSTPKTLSQTVLSSPKRRRGCTVGHPLQPRLTVPHQTVPKSQPPLGAHRPLEGGGQPPPLPEAICCPVSVCDRAHQPRDHLGPFPVKVMARPCPPTLPQSDLGAPRWSRPLPTPPQWGPAPLPLSSRSALAPARNARSLSFPSRCTPPHTAVAAPHTPCLFPLLSCAARTGGHVPARRGGTGGQGANEGLRSSQ